MKLIHLGNAAPCHYEKSDLTDDPVLAAEQPVFDTVTEILVSPTSTLVQALGEIARIWALHSHNDAPDWIGHNPEAAGLAALLADHYGITDVREI